MVHSNATLPAAARVCKILYFTTTAFLATSQVYEKIFKRQIGSFGAHNISNHQSSQACSCDEACQKGKNEGQEKIADVIQGPTVAKWFQLAKKALNLVI